MRLVDDERPSSHLEGLPADRPWSLGFEPGHGYEAAIYYGPELISRSTGRTPGEAVSGAVMSDRRRAALRTSSHGLAYALLTAAAPRWRPRVTAIAGGLAIGLPLLAMATHAAGLWP